MTKLEKQLKISSATLRTVGAPNRAGVENRTGPTKEEIFGNKFAREGHDVGAPQQPRNWCLLSGRGGEVSLVF